ncbi:GTPase activating protein-like protein [Calycina marina]|uniref:GTPase activating protein-like protein n=1 Tax=Calycina marina TaxID=1763456 RepID=A0A9P8CIF8_9HELO|nr:GTPase activating protein-like protein [Calycina marina]
MSVPEGKLHSEADVDSELVDDSPAEATTDAKPESHDSMVTVRLSEPPAPGGSSELGPHEFVEERSHTQEVTISTGDKYIPDEEEQSPRIMMVAPNGEVTSPSGSGSTASANGESRRGSDSSESDMGEVNWEELKKTEDQEPRDESSDDSTALLLARLEQENNLLATNPKSGLVKSPQVDELVQQSRPPSIQHLKRLVNGPTPLALRYSMIPAPPMTDLEFYAALVQDYTRTAQCLPTLLSKKIRSGVPPPLRGVVWQSMSGARDRLLEDQFDRLCLESSPYDGIIGKDLGRSFPGVEMFRDPKGDGQRMLGRVLKCFSLYDHKIGYCQGLGFLVGPLLMHMGEKQAFCILVRLMEHYDLRNCFLPDLSGLHVRIYQFRELLKEHMPVLSNHLDFLQIEPAYVSQWFLSFFGVTCPLPMLFRIYDVIFAEGASETIMRVALSLMRKNEEKILACTEFEDVMQLLLSRGLWDCYHYNADDFVNDFVSLTGVVTHESLQTLEISFKNLQTVDAAPSETVGTTASSFLGRLWAGSNSSTKSVSLSPNINAPSRPMSFLRRTPSKQSIATLASAEGTGSDSIMSASTDTTSISRDSSHTDASSIRVQSVGVHATTKSNKDRNLHGQIEDLLTALSEMQRDHAILATQLQREREEREEDRSAVKSLLDVLKTTELSVQSRPGDAEELDGALAEGVEASDQNGDTPLAESAGVTDSGHLDGETSPVEMIDLLSVLENFEAQFDSVPSNRRTSMLQSKSQLREELARSKEQLINEVSKIQDFSRRLSDHEQEIANLKDQVREGHTHIRNAHQEKQRLEKQIHDFRVKKTPTASSDTREWPEPERRASGHSTGGLRELRLVRSNSKAGQSAFSKRTSSLNTAAIAINTQAQNHNHFNRSQSFASINITPIDVTTPPELAKDVDVDSLVLELVQAKTAQAEAKQEAEEAKAKLEGMRKLLGMKGDGVALRHNSSPSQPNLMKRTNAPSPAVSAQTPASASPGGFWGGWGKKTSSTE